MVALYDVNLFSTSASLSLRTPWLPQAKWIGWVSWFLMRLISDRILWTLEIISLFDEAVSCLVLRTNFSSSSFVLLDTTWASSTVVFTSWGSVDLMRTKSLRDYLKLPGATDRDWASLGISIMALPSCLGNIWASANGAVWSGWIAARRSSFATKKPSEIVVFQALKRWGTSRLPLSLDFLELVVWNRKEVRKLLSVGSHIFPRLEVYLVVILLKSLQKQSAGWLSYWTHTGG